MAQATKESENALRRFRADKILTLTDLMALLRCSRSTVQRRLKAWECLNSYNCNGAYYALPETVAFDCRGIWRCRNARFSRYGNLTSTVVGVISDSEAGMSAGELSKVLDMNAYSFISQFTSHPRLRRDKYGARYVYFSSDPQRGQQQRAARQNAYIEAALPSDAESVLILAEMLRHPGRDMESLSSVLKSQGVEVSPYRIQSLLDHHGLTLPVKKNGARIQDSACPQSSAE